MCREDIFFWISLFCWQQNPKHVGTEIGPFITWDYQEEGLRQTIQWLFADLPDYPDDVLWEKSREMGATWLALILALWLCLFHPNKRVLCISHTEEAVTKAGDEGTLFAKIQFMLDYLPDWMKVGVKKWKKGYKFANRSTISAQASTKRTGVGDRVTFILCDEFSKHEKAAEIWGQTADTGPRLVIGTHYGIGGMYYDLTQEPGMKKLIWHWSMHPEKKIGLYHVPKEDAEPELLDKKFKFQNYDFVRDGSPHGGPFPGLRSPWYDREVIRRHRASKGRGTRDVAMHLDIDPAGSDTQFFDRVVIRSLIVGQVLNPLWQGDIDCESGYMKRLKEESGGPLRLWRLPDPYGKFPVSKYGAGSDLSTGNGSTPTILCVGDAMTGEMILEYANPFMGGERFAPIAAAILRMFLDQHGQPPLLAWEMQGPGDRFGTVLMEEVGYRRVFRHRSTNPQSLTLKISDKAGWYSSPKDKRALLENYRDGLYTGKFKNRSRQSLEECNKFRYGEDRKIDHSLEKTTTDPSEGRQNHADRAFGAALCYLCMCQLGLEQQLEIKHNPVVVGSWRWRRELAERQILEAEDECA
jgi:hypothetical protein